MGFRTERLDVTALESGRLADVDAGPRHSDHSQVGDLALDRWKRLHQPREQLRPHARTADGCNADDLIVAVAKPATQLSAIAERLLVQAENVPARELLMPL